MDEPDAEEEAVVARIQAQDAAFAELDRQHRTYAVRGPIRVEVHGERYEVPLTVRDVRAALPAELRTAFDDEIDGAPPAVTGRLIRKWALETISATRSTASMSCCAPSSWRPGSGRPPRDLPHRLRPHRRRSPRQAPFPNRFKTAVVRTLGTEPYGHGSTPVDSDRERREAVVSGAIVRYVISAGILTVTVVGLVPEP
ncbi:hypothetical protein [Streptomyces sp. NPDC050804]|uniref:hypothetical protein n=1 Tax=Streptomyces sp. NPDC050804 TaxID=3154745 RepID=UPI00343C2F60